MDISGGQYRLLVIDDNIEFCRMLAGILGSDGYHVTMASDRTQLEGLAKTGRFDLILLETSFKSLDPLKFIREHFPSVPIIIITRQPSLETAIEAVHYHAEEYLCKPIEFGELKHLIHQTLHSDSKSVGVADGGRGSDSRATSEDTVNLSEVLIGNNPAIARLRRLIRDVAPTDLSILIRGESGTGKNVVAQLVHEQSGRSERGNFIKLNCPSIPQELFESELFGHESGAFTGAHGCKPGRVEMANHGTLFLDEITEIPPFIQAKLLQFIEEKKFVRLGSNSVTTVDSRIIAATNADLERLMRESGFRLDLFYRLNEYVLVIPPLRERIEDIPLLVEHFIKSNSQLCDGRMPRLTDTMLNRLMHYHWPGNVRELETIVKRFLLAQDEEVINQIFEFDEDEIETRADGLGRIRQGELATIEKILHETNWNRRKAAQVLGISYNTLRRRIEEYQLRPSYTVDPTK